MQTVLLGDPSQFRIRVGGNPHTRDRWGRRKRVDSKKAFLQWSRLKEILEEQAVRVHSLPAVEDSPGLVYPANAGFRFGDRFYLSNLNPGRAAEKEHYRKAISQLGLQVLDLVSQFPFEGEADFFPVGDPSGDPRKSVYIFTHGPLETPHWKPRLGFPPYRRIYGFRSDLKILLALEAIVQPLEVVALELADEAHYHGDTVLCSFGPHREFLLAYLPGLSPLSQARLQDRWGGRLLLLSEEDGRRFAANSFQVTVERNGLRLPVLLMPDGLTLQIYEQVRDRGVVPLPVDVSEFLEKGGGALKCMLLDLGEL